MLTRDEIIEKRFLLQAIVNPDRMRRPGLTQEQVLDRLNKLSFKELHDEDCPAGLDKSDKRIGRD